MFGHTTQTKTLETTVDDLPVCSVSSLLAGVSSLLAGVSSLLAGVSLAHHDGRNRVTGNPNARRDASVSVAPDAVNGR